jgi:hypothetical protein
LEPIRSTKGVSDATISTGGVGSKGYKTSRTGIAHVMAELKRSDPKRRPALPLWCNDRLVEDQATKALSLPLWCKDMMDGTSYRRRRHRLYHPLPWTNTLIDHGLGPSCKVRRRFPPLVWRCGNQSPSKIFRGEEDQLHYIRASLASVEGIDL